MATTIVTKNGSGAPAASDLVAGELAVDLTNGRLYTEDSGGSVIEIGLNPSGNVDVTGTVTADGLTVSASAATANITSTSGGATLNLTHPTAADGYSIRQGNANADDFRIFEGSKIKLNITTGGDISFYEDTGTTAKLFWDASAESLGIGTSSPFFTAAGRSSLSVNGTSSSILAFGKGGSSENYILADAGGLTIANTSATLPTAFFNNGSTRMTISSAGTVGIGMAPDANNVLSVKNTSGKVISLTNGVDADLYVDLTSGLTLVSPSTGTLAFGTSNTERMRLDSSGNLLVGKTANNITDTGVVVRSTGETFVTRSGAEPLSINRLSTDGDVLTIRKDSAVVGSIGTEGGDLTIGSSASGHKGVRFGANYIAPINTSNAFEDNTTDLGLPAVRFKDLYMSGIIAKGTGGELDLRSDGGGFNYKQNLDVATAGCTLTGQSTRGDMAAIRLYQTATGADGGYIRFDTCNSGSTTLTEKARLDSSGTLMVGKSSGAASDDGHQIFGTGQHYYYSTATEVQRFYETTTQNQVGSIAITTSATTYNTSSDYRLKDNIADAPSASDDIDAIQVRSFDWKSDGSHQKYGMVAQELQTVAPEAVSGDPESEEMMGVDYSKLVPMMLKEIQSLRARVAQLES